MKRRAFLRAAATTPILAKNAAARGDAPGNAAPHVFPIPIAADETILYESPDAAKVYAYSPGLARLPSGRLVATMDQGGPGVNSLPGMKFTPGGYPYKAKIWTSDDQGKTWDHRADVPLEHARPFAAGNAVYVLGQFNDLGVTRSDDGGTTWGPVVPLTQGQRWHQAPCNVHYTRGRVYLVMERKTDEHGEPAALAVVLMRADINADLTRRDAWTFSDELTFNQAVQQYGPSRLAGIPFFGEQEQGWLETNVVQFSDPDHVWHDPAGRTFHLWLRAYTGLTGYAAIAKAVEDESGAITVSLERAPSGEPIFYVPCPGGYMKFHILYDDQTKLFWLLANQSTDSMTRPDRLTENRDEEEHRKWPNNERHRLVLYFSRNCMDWIFACRIADSGTYGQGRHYASMVFDGDDLHVLSRSGDHRAKDAHDGNLITFHTVPAFRSLIY
jgi:hypothetical protein